MSSAEFQLRVENLPAGSTKNHLKILLQNPRKQGGGPVDNIDWDEGSDIAIVTFKEKAAVDIVLQRGDVIEFRQTQCKVSRVSNGSSRDDRPKTLVTASESSQGVRVFDKPGPKAEDSSPIKSPRSSFQDDKSKSPSSSSEIRRNSDFSDGPKSPGASAKPVGSTSVPKNSTIQVNINRVNVDLEEYILYFEDDSINTGKFDKNRIFMDGLKMSLYVTFDRPEDAKRLCTEDCDSMSNIKNIRMAEDGVHDHYNNLLSIHGMDFSGDNREAKLKTYVKEKTGFTPAKVMREKREEPCSAILVFGNDVKDIYSIAWKCVGELDGVQLFTAPVQRCSTVLASVYESIEQSTIERYFKNRDKSGGGQIQSCKPVDGRSFLVTFCSADDAVSVYGKRDHSIGSKKIKVELWQHCLSREAYAAYLTLSGEAGNINIPPSPESHSPSHRLQAQDQKSESKTLPSHIDTVSNLKVKPHELILLKNSNYIDELAEESDVIIETDDETTITINGNKKSTKTVENSINEKLLGFERTKLDGFDEKINELIFMESVLNVINNTLAEKKKIAFVTAERNKLWCWFDNDKENIKVIKAMIIDVFINESRVFEDQIMALTCDEGKKFISQLMSKSKNPCKIQVDPDKKEVEVVTLGTSTEIAVVWYDIDMFMKSHTIVTDIVPFPELKRKYADKFLKKELTSCMDNLKASGAVVTMRDGQIDVTGLKSGIFQAQDQMAKLREKITLQDETVTGFGIAEFLNTDRGNNILGEIGHGHRCLLIPKDNLALDGLPAGPNQTRGSLIGTCVVGGFKVKFVLGDITSLDTNVIVNPVGRKLQCDKGMNKVIIQNGGDQIQQELNRYHGSKEVGEIISTPGGRLPCSSVYHLILRKDTDANDLLKCVKDILKKADQDGHKSVAMPLLGCGRFRIPQVGAGINISKAVKQCAGQSNTLQEIIICDNDPTNVQSIIGRFDDVEEHCSLDEIIGQGTPDDKSSHRSHHRKGGRDRSSKESKANFGSVTLTIKKGDILQEKCDAVVCGIKENMDLKSGGAVSKAMLKMCGSSLQTECTQKVEELADAGAVTTSANGLTTCSAILFVSMTKYARSWHKGLDKVLSLAEENGYTSLALPALGTGARHANIPGLKHTIMRGIKKFGESSKSQTLKDIRLVIFDDKVLHVFQEDGDHRGKQDHEDAADEPDQPIPVISKNVKVQLVYHKSAEGMDAIRALKDRCVKEFFKRDTKMDLKSLSERETNQIVVKGLRKQVQVTMRRETGAISLASFDRDAVMDLLDEIHKVELKMKDSHYKQQVRSVKTAFKWQFLSRDKWRDFEPEVNIEIEKAFKKSKDGSIEISDPSNRKYKINFKDMKEYKYKSDGKLEELTTVNRYDLEAAGERLPREWDKMNGENLKAVPLSSSSQEYQDVVKYFQQCGASVAVKKIERIQNVVLYQQYASKKRYFEKTNPQGTQNEMKLFHGTDPAAIANINASGFNRSFCGKNATMYGNGVYFAEQSSYSVNYARADPQGNKMMYMAKVLVGVSTPSQSGMTHLPNKPGTNVPYDSGKGPSMYIIYHDCQAYPEYLIYF